MKRSYSSIRTGKKIFGDVEKYNLKIKKRSDAQDNLKKKQDEIMEKMKNNTKTAGFFK
jgi:hypothetical protein